MQNRIIVISEEVSGHITNATLEALGKAVSLRGTKDISITAFFISSVLEDSAALLKYGADEVFLADIKGYSIDPYVSVVSDIIKKYEPLLVIAPASVHVNEYLPMVAARLDIQIISDLISFETKDDGSATFTRPVFGGKALLKGACDSSKTILLTLRQNIFKPVTPREQFEERLTNIPVNIADSDIRVRIAELVQEVSGEIELTDAKIVVSGGRGLKEGENFKLIKALADALGGAVGASRAAVDAGWIEEKHQVGQTGKTVSPDLYIACGISGSIQHMAGMSSSKYILAINNDPDANIFKVADYGIVGDLFTIMPLLTEEIKRQIFTTEHTENTENSGS